MVNSVNYGAMCGVVCGVVQCGVACGVVQCVMFWCTDDLRDPAETAGGGRQLGGGAALRSDGVDARLSAAAVGRPLAQPSARPLPRPPRRRVRARSQGTHVDTQRAEGHKAKVSEGMLLTRCDLRFQTEAGDMTLAAFALKKSADLSFRVRWSPYSGYCVEDLSHIARGC